MSMDSGSALVCSISSSSVASVCPPAGTEHLVTAPAISARIRRDDDPVGSRCHAECGQDLIGLMQEPHGHVLQLSHVLGRSFRFLVGGSE